MDVRHAAVEVVRAAGGVVWRSGPGNSVEYAIVHRPVYDDWTLPKGKLAPGETEEEAALREVEEETGMRCRLGRALGTTSYPDRKGRPKIVYYWLMKAVAGRFVPNAEVDELRWLTITAATALLTYDRDRTLLGSLAAPEAEELAG